MGAVEEACVRIQGALDGRTNMRLDAELLAAAEAGAFGCRVYFWEGPWISLGRFQSPGQDLLPDCPTPYVMRPTGGKAVLHGHDVTVGLAAPLPTIESARGIKGVYRALAAPIIEALRECGLPAVLAEETRFLARGPRTADCFAHVSPNDIVDEGTGQKVCGSAMRLTRSAVLLQASIPAGHPLVDPAAAIRGGQSLVAPPWASDGFAAAIRRTLTVTSWLR